MDELQYSRYGLLLPRDQAYDMDLNAIRHHFGRGNHARRNVFDGLAAGVDNMFSSGVKRIVIGGSFISRKREPRDVDLTWWYDPEIDWSHLDPVFQLPSRRAARAKYLGPIHTILMVAVKAKNRQSRREEHSLVIPNE